ncbi:MAG: hypothetical protein RDV41_04580, partial [Planctomycetota bacterium]|nr:hypothetical protein [Planctomycetota bacterium]
MTLVYLLLARRLSLTRTALSEMTPVELKGTEAEHHTPSSASRIPERIAPMERGAGYAYVLVPALSAAVHETVF